MQSDESIRNLLIYSIKVRIKGEGRFHSDTDSFRVTMRRYERMKIVIIHGQNHKGSTYHIAHALAEKTGGEMTEFFLPKDFGAFCVGCTQCFIADETKCPHYHALQPITQAIDAADLIILASPVYVFHATGAMKTLLDHYGYRWMVHRPFEGMFRKQAVCIATAAGSGMKSANKDMADSLFYWGVPKIYRYGKAIAATSWETLSEAKKQRIDHDLDKLAAKITRHAGRVKTGLKTKAFFMLMRQLQKNGWNPADVQYWHEKGWTDKKRPWKD